VEGFLKEIARHCRIDPEIMRAVRFALAPGLHSVVKRLIRKGVDSNEVAGVVAKYYNLNLISLTNCQVDDALIETLPAGLFRDAIGLPVRLEEGLETCLLTADPSLTLAQRDLFSHHQPMPLMVAPYVELGEALCRRFGPKLVRENEDGSREIFPLLSEEVKVGKVAGNQVILGHSTVSRRHARITRKASVFHLIDLHSSNGTTLNGRSIHGEEFLTSGDVIGFGKVEVVFQDFDEEEVPSTALMSRNQPSELITEKLGADLPAAGESSASEPSEALEPLVTGEHPGTEPPVAGHYPFEAAPELQDGSEPEGSEEGTRSEDLGLMDRGPKASRVVSSKAGATAGAEAAPVGEEIPEQPSKSEKKKSSSGKKTSENGKKASSCQKKTSSGDKKSAGEKKKVSSEKKKASSEKKKASSEKKKTSNEKKKTSSEKKKASNEEIDASSKGQKLAREGQVSSGEGQVSSGEGQVSSGEGQISSGEGQVSSGEGQVSSGKGQVRSGEGQTAFVAGQAPSREGTAPENTGDDGQSTRKEKGSKRGAKEGGAKSREGKGGKQGAPKKERILDSRMRAAWVRLAGQFLAALCAALTPFILVYYLQYGANGGGETGLLAGFSSQQIPEHYDFSGSYEPSGVIQIPGSQRILFVDDSQAGRLFTFGVDAEGDLIDEKPEGRRFKLKPKPDDLEGLTSSPAGLIFATTSHALASNGKHLNDGLLCFKPKEKGHGLRLVGHVKTLRKLIHQTYPRLKPFRTLPPASGGLNIEGLAYDLFHDRLLLGLRSPVINGKAQIVALRILDPTDPLSKDSLKLEPELIELDLGGGGIRGMEFDPNYGEFLILSGGSVNAGTFHLWKWSGGEEPAEQITQIAFEHGWKPEGIARVTLTEQSDASFLMVVDDANGYMIIPEPL